MSDTKSLDGKLRERGRAKLRSELNKIFEQLKPFMYSPAKIPNLKTNSGDIAYTREVSDMLKTAIFDHHSADWEEKEIREFITQVDSLSQQVADLHDGFEG